MRRGSVTAERGQESPAPSPPLLRRWDSATGERKPPPCSPSGWSDRDIVVYVPYVMVIEKKYCVSWKMCCIVNVMARAGSASRGRAECCVGMFAYECAYCEDFLCAVRDIVRDRKRVIERMGSIVDPPGAVDPLGTGTNSIPVPSKCHGVWAQR
ncbi:hypothetical protein NDU88_008634 [Pleurodeles waltl]|uniref:Uncharacterized protein n=1 Tax=Pleurodeles waltl TaxID=8319 RepID=A0AAV7PX73_PLEWA|nr:hypothetical protein NDU88_008634 [Pleurodeles waltl]